MIPESIEFLVLGREKLMLVVSIFLLATTGKAEVSMSASPDDSTNILVKSTSFEGGLLSIVKMLLWGDGVILWCCCWLRCDTLTTEKTFIRRGLQKIYDKDKELKFRKNMLEMG